jgi:peptidoglycan/xylan/chitin deacetylase (PgdA/CDA1 family)
MSLRRFFARSLALSAFALIATAAQGCASESGVDENSADTAGAQSATRPPQFVLLAFDGSFNNAFWQESRTFAKANGVKFTYFVNPSYYIARKNGTNRQYAAPPVSAPRVGSSAIGFGDNSNNPSETLDDIKQRLELTAMARADGNEIGSHAVGHFDGSTWSSADWESEFKQFNDIFFSAARSAGFPEVNLGFDKSDLVGFRAPQLGHSPGLYSVLAENGFKYDTSRVAQPNHWPRRDEAGNQGVWNFALASLKIQGSGGSAGKNTLSMDYNFYVADSKGVADPNPANFAIHERNMLETYRAYFAGNYYGNRAPLQIGHHFSKWNGGAYWNAMQKFAKEVCGLPEVQCVTHKEVVSFLEKNESSLRDFQAGAFPKLARPPGDDAVDIGAPIDESAIVREGDGAHSDD